MPSLSLHFQFTCLLKVYSPVGLVCTTFTLGRHLAGACMVMWVRMSIMGCFATRAACCGAVPIKHSLIAQPDSDVWGRVQTLQASCKSRETERVCVSRRGIYSSFLCVNGSFWNSELEFKSGREEKNHLVKYFLVQWSSDRHRWERWVLGHTRVTPSWILWFVLLQTHKKNESQGFGTIARETVGMFALVCVRGGDADGLQLQLWESRAGAGALRAGWEAGEPGGEGAALFLLLPYKGCYNSPKEGLGCMDREQVMVWEKTSLTGVSDSSFMHKRYCHMLFKTF